MNLDLGAGGLVGLLTPRENPTAEPEASVLLPPDVALLAARMHSPAPAMSQRLIDYGRDLRLWLDAFGKAPLDAVGYACTGTSYLIDEPLPDRVEHAGRAIPLVTAAAAIEAALRDLGARTAALVTPYPEDLTEAATAYWRGRGFGIVAVEPMAPARGHHPIYGQNNAAAWKAIRAAGAAQADVVLALGTGAPTLAAMAMARRDGAGPMLSSNLCLGWRLSSVLAGEAAEPLSAWLAADAPWVRRLADRFPASFTQLQTAGNHP